MKSPEADPVLHFLRDTLIALGRHDGRNLTLRQLAIFLTCYLQDRDHTVRGLAADLKISRPAVTHVLDRLGEFDLAQRKADPRDRRSVLVQRTASGRATFRNLRRSMDKAAATSRLALSAAPVGA